MSWIADAGIAGLAQWAALVLAGLVAGTFVSRWNERGPDPRAGEPLLLAAAAAAVIAWFANAGSLIGGAESNQLLRAYVPIEVEPGYRLAVLWATLPGAALTFATALLVRASLATRAGGTSRARHVAACAMLALVALGVAVWFAPSPIGIATAIPPFVQSAPAALAPVCAVGTVVLLADAAAARIAGLSPDPLALRAAWLLATAALGAEQMARSRLGIGPRDAILLGSASSGLVLWLVTSALLHGRVQTWLLRNPVRAARNRAVALTSHIGAALLAVSFALHALAARTTVAIPAGSSIEVTDSFKRNWRLANQGVSRFDEDGVDVLSLALEATRPSGGAVLLAPEIRDYHGRNGQHLDPPVARRQATGGATQTLRVLLVDADSLDAARVRVTFLPVPILWPIGIGLLVVAALFPRRTSSNDPGIE